MARRPSATPVAQKVPMTDAKSAPIKDSVTNFMANLGIGANNLTTATSYTLNPLTRQRVQLEFMYRGSWLIGIGVDSRAEDMTKEGIEFTGEIDPAQIAHLDRAMTRLYWWQHLCDWLKWGALYGGSIAVMLIDGQDVESPLDLDTVGKGQFKGFYVFDRWQLNPAYGAPVRDLGPFLGMPSYYQPTGEAIVYRGKKIHYTRCLRDGGIALPYFQRLAESGWGLSVVERVYDRLIAFDSATQGASQLIFKAYLRTLKVEGLRQIIAAGGKALQGLQKNIEMIRATQSFEGITLLDGADDFQTHQYSFAGLSDLLIQFGQQISGAFQTPMVRLFGQSPAGLNSTGESDLRIYNEGIGKAQEARRSQIGTALNILYRSEFGKPPPDDFDFKFKPLQKISHAEKVDIASKVTETIIAAYGANLISQQRGLEELKQSSDETGIWTNISGEDIEAADDEPPSPDEVMPETDPETGEAIPKPPKSGGNPKPDDFAGKEDVPG